MERRASLLALLLVTFVITTAPAWGQSFCNTFAGNLVTNCGFETGDFTGWTQSGNLGNTGVSTVNPFSGNYSAYLGPVGSDGFLTQNVGAAGDTSYFVGFVLYNDGATPNDFTVYWNGTDFGPDLVNAGPFPYSAFTFAVPGNAAPGANSLTFAFREDGAYWYLDDVVVIGVSPEPGTLTLMGSGILGLAAVVCRKLKG